MVSYPNGERHWPLVGLSHTVHVAPVRQFQLIQHTLEDIEVRLVATRPLGAEEEARVGDVIRNALGHPFRLKFVYFAGEKPRGPGGKFEEFVSRVGSAR